MVISQADSTLTAIRKKVRRLTNSPGQSSLTDDDLDQAINTFYNNDFPYAIKIDQMRDIYEIFTKPYIDRYPLDVNYFQGVRAPVYFDGIQGSFYKDRTQFFNMWPKIYTQFQPISGNGSTQAFTFNIPGPFLSNEVTLGGIDNSGNAIQVKDNGSGQMWYITENAQTFTPPLNSNPAIPGMPNGNLGNPGLQQPVYIGTVDYVTGDFVLDFSLASVTPAAGTVMTLFVSQYQPGRPYNLLFWNNEFVVRPVPKLVHKITVEIYQTPVQFMATSDHPILNQWWQYLSYGTACEIQRERNDFESVAALMEGMKRQEAMVLERQGVEEIGQPNYNLFNTSLPNPYLNNFWGMGGF